MFLEFRLVPPSVQLKPRATLMAGRFPIEIRCARRSCEKGYLLVLLGRIWLVVSSFFRNSMGKLTCPQSVIQHSLCLSPRLKIFGQTRELWSFRGITALMAEHFI
jgi:hypothetical protein